MSKWIAAVLILTAVDAQAWGCKYERTLDQALAAHDSNSLFVRALAGNLEISGADIDEIQIKGTACASTEEWLEQIAVEAIAGEEARVTVLLPDVGGGWSISGGNYAFVDLVLEVPQRLAVEVQDSSGDIEIRNLQSATIKDSSGGIELVHMSGRIELSDSSGDILVEDLDGDLVIASDSSGDVSGRGITGSVTVLQDSSGGLSFSDIGGSVLIERDSSGDISVVDVGGDFTVLKDGSGKIRSSGVKGKVSIPD